MRKPLLLLAAILAPLAAHAQIVAAPTAPANQRPTVLNAANGVPQVDIQTPSAAGVSRNTYSQFDVQRPGAILNNSRTNVQTQLGGWVQGNPWLAAGSARVILNEVQSSNPSLLGGYVEVAGSRAQVVIANPAGISCDGCGFINASRATLTTGTPIVNGGNLDGYRVQGGTIAITGAGMDASTTDTADLIARAVQVNAGIWANHLKVTTGPNQVDADNNTATPITTSAGSGATPAYAIDVAALGGMYAGKIILVGTEAGLGVRNAGAIGASAGDVIVTVDGRLENAASATIAASGKLALTADSLASTGTLLSQGDTSIKLAQDYTHAGTLQAGGNLDFETAGTFTNPITLQAGGTLTLRAAALDNPSTGQLLGSNLTLAVTGTLTNRGLIDGGATRITAATLSNLGSGRLYGDHLAIGATTLNNLAEGGQAPVIAARSRLDLGAGTIQNREHALIFSAGDLKIGGALDANGYATGSATTLANASATIESLGNLDLAALDITNTNEHFATQVATVSSATVNEYQGAGAGTRYPTASYYACVRDALYCALIGGGGYQYWYHYNFTRSVTETQVSQSDPAQILAGGTMSLTAATLLNDKSRIIAGGLLTASLGSLTNTDVTGTRTTSDVGSSTYYFAVQPSGSNNDYVGTSTAGYAPAPSTQSLSLAPTLYQQNTAPTGSGTAVAATPLAALPGSSLFSRSSAGTRYLIETDPRFASYRSWLGSDFMLQALALDPALTQKRLGDGFYEQKLIREQVASLTGRRFLDGYASDEAQFRALMEQGVLFARAHQLVPGVALTAEQMAQLTSDIVWLVERMVTLPDGSQTTALVPQVYVRVRDGDLAPTGALLAGESVQLNLAGDLQNGGTIAGRTLVSLTAENVANLGRIQGSAVDLQAQRDLLNLGGTIQAGDSLAIAAGRDLTVQSTTRSNANAQGGNTTLDRIAGLYVTNPGGTLLASAGRDMNLIAATLQSRGGATLLAGNDLKLGTVTESNGNTVVWDARNRLAESRSTETGTSIQTQGDLTLAAGRDVSARAAQVTSTAGALNVTAGRDVAIRSGEASQSLDEAHHYETKGGGVFAGRESETRNGSSSRTTALASSLGGQTVTVQAGRDIGVRGSSVVSDGGTTLTAGNDVRLEAATNTDTSSSFEAKSRSGVSFGGGGIFVGSRKQSTEEQGSGTTAAASTVGSTRGDVTIRAGNAYAQTGSEVLAPGGRIDVAAKTVQIQEARNIRSSSTTTQSEQSGLSIGVANSLVTAAQTVQALGQAAGQTSDPRMQALAAATAGLAGKNALDAVSGPAGFDPAKAASVNVGISVGSSKSRSTTTQTSDTAAGSTVAAGRDLSIRATGGDLVSQGGTITAGNDVDLSATGNIALLAAANTSSSQSSSSGSSASIGVGIGVGPGQGVGISATASASQSSGSSSGQDTTWTNAKVSAGTQSAVGTASLSSGADTTLKGATVEGRQVIADIGGNLNIESLQDTSSYASQQKSSGFSISVPIGPGTVGGSVSSSLSKIASTYASVNEQSGIRAGDGGFQVNVAGNTDLKGGAITSRQAALDENRNRFETGGELTLADIRNQAEYQAKSASVSLGVGTSFDGRLIPGGTSAGIGKDGNKAGSATLAAISGIAGNADARTSDDETGIGRIFDAQKVQKEINAQAVITQSFGQQASKAVGDYATSRLDEAQALRAQGREQEAKDLESLWGANGTARLAAHALIGGLTGGASGAAGAAAGTLTAPAVSEALRNAGIDGPLATAITDAASTAVGAVVGGTAGAASALNEVANNYLSHPENALRATAREKLKNCEDDSCEQAAQAEIDKWNAEDLRRDAEFHAACDGELSTTAGCADMTRDLYKNLGTYAAADARLAASSDKSGSLTQAHKEELQSYLDPIKTANANVRTSDSRFVRGPDRYDSDPYGVVNPNNTRDAYLAMKFGTEALALANVNENGNYAIVTQWWARNGMNNPPDYATGLMLTHVDAAAEAKQKAISEAQRTNNPYTPVDHDPYLPVDRYTLSYAPTTGFWSDLWSASLTKMGVESESVLGLRAQQEAIQTGNRKVDWVAHSRGGPEYVQAAVGSSIAELEKNSVVFHAGANNKIVTDYVMRQKGIGDAVNEENRYRDNSNDLVPQIVGLRALTEPLNFFTSLISAPCLSSSFCTIQQSPHTLPANWHNLAPEAK
ncbi:MAG: hemagglutinin repeat-containing protein [Gammaproteobacteria bacterium]|nr:hemagglutinin repeat-containing protein [Gammaproteobacteria bacterium]